MTSLLIIGLIYNPNLLTIDLTDRKGISHNSIVWVDHSTIKQQCIDGIKVVNGRVTVNFDYNDKSYTLYDLTDDQYNDMINDPKDDYVPDEEYDVEERLKIVMTKLQSDDLLMLNYELVLINEVKLFLGGPFDTNHDEESGDD